MGSRGRDPQRSVRVRGFLATALCCALLAVGVVGCDRGTVVDSADRTEIRDRVITAERPPQAMTIEEAREAAGEETELAVRGKVDAGEFDPFEPDRAEFLIRDLVSDEQNDSGHDASNCPFCKRKVANAAQALVVVTGGDGETVAEHAAKLLGIGKGSVLVVRGPARWDDSVQMLTIRGEQIFVEP